MTNAPERYALIVTDVFTKFCWLRMLETRSADEITRCYESILEEIRPHLLKTTLLWDQEGGVQSAQFRAMLKKFDVQLQFSYTETKASNAEILIRLGPTINT